MSREKEYLPPWSDEAPEAGSYRSVFKWGDPSGFKHPNRKLYRYMKEQFRLSDDDFRVRVKEGREPVTLSGMPSRRFCAPCRFGCDCRRRKCSR